MSYPFGCSEQTSAKLSGLAVLYQAVSRGILKKDIHEIEHYIHSGLKGLMGSFYRGKNGFAYWEGEKAKTHATIWVLQNMRPFIGLKETFPLAWNMMEESVKGLLSQKVKDQSLLVYDKGFLKDPERLKRDLYDQIYLLQCVPVNGGSNPIIQNIIGRVKSQAVFENGFVYWDYPLMWGGPLQTTCEALRSLLRWGDTEYLNRGLPFIGHKLMNNELNTTSDTRALIELLTEMEGQKDIEVEIDGIRKQIDCVEKASRMTILSDDLLVKVTSNETIDYTQSKSDFPFRVEMPDRAKVGDKVFIKIISEVKDEGELPVVPAARVYLPPNLALLKGGANVQGLYEPLRNGSLELDAIAIRQGEGFLLVIVHDMYQTERVGVSPKTFLEIL